MGKGNKIEEETQWKKASISIKEKRTFNFLSLRVLIVGKKNRGRERAN